MMKLTINNHTYNIVNAKSFWQKFMGLMGQKNINYGMLFKNIGSIHTFFMKENIDVIVLDKDNYIVDIRQNMQKNHIYIAQKKHKKTSILELPQNASKNLKVGDYLTFISE